MDIQSQINDYISNMSEQKQNEMQILHNMMMKLFPNCKLWFLDGKNSDNKTVSNPNIGYGLQQLKYADGTTRGFYQIGLSANKTGISVYIIGLKDKKYLSDYFGSFIGKASITGYCIKFKSIKDIHFDILQEAIKYGISQTNN